MPWPGDYIIISRASVSHIVQVFGPDWNISYANKQLTIKCTDIQGPQKVNPNYCVDQEHYM